MPSAALPVSAPDFAESQTAPRPTVVPAQTGTTGGKLIFANSQCVAVPRIAGGRKFGIIAKKSEQMQELTKAQMERQDEVDNAIHELVNELLPPGKTVEWDIDLIGEIRDTIREQLAEKRKLAADAEFYPFTEY